MNLFKNIDRVEGQDLPKDTLLCFGKSILSNGQYDGWYFKLASPIDFTEEYIDPATIETTVGKCRRSVFFLRRFANVYRNGTVMYRHTKVPV